ncbi:MAG: aspartate carbamoyltransferase catalytic subunit [Phycisphaerales bacterium]
MWCDAHLLSTHNADAESLRRLLDRAADESFDADALAGRAVANLFFEDSTRTRVSFSLAAQRLGARVVDWTSAGSSVSKGESLLDTFSTIESMGFDAVVVRHAESGAASLLAEHARCAVINAGDGTHQHPTQALADALALGEALDRDRGWDFSGLTVAIVGDCVSSRVARSNVGTLTALGARVVLVGPDAMAPSALGEALGCEVSNDLDAVLPEIDAAMMLRIQLERGAGSLLPEGFDYTGRFGLTRERFDRLSDGAVVMHPGPMNRGVEIDGVVADSTQSIILKQVEAGVRVRMAVLDEAIVRRSASSRVQS